MQKLVLLKITGEFLRNENKDIVDSSYIRGLARQIKSLRSSHYFGIVGGGNFFKGSREGDKLGMSPETADYVGMLATVMNGIILQDIFGQEGLDAKLFSAFDCPNVASTISPQELKFGLRASDCMIFAGGIGNPFFTTDTAAIVRAIQIGAHEVWKATKVDGVYTEDPRINSQAKRIPVITFAEALDRHIGVMDETAFALAKEHKLPIKIFSLFAPDSLIMAAKQTSFGSMVIP
jgi:uridylate kinase